MLHRSTTLTVIFGKPSLSSKWLCISFGAKVGGGSSTVAVNIPARIRPYFLCRPTAALTCAGAIPPELGELAALEDLVMPYNNLSGKCRPMYTVMLWLSPVIALHLSSRSFLLILAALPRGVIFGFLQRHAVVVSRDCPSQNSHQYLLFCSCISCRQYPPGARPAERSEEAVFSRQLPRRYGSDAFPGSLFVLLVGLRPLRQFFPLR